MIPDKHLESLAPCLVGHDGKPLVRNGAMDSQALESYLSEDELLDEEDEADMSLLPQTVRLLLHVTFKRCFINVSDHVFYLGLSVFFYLLNTVVGEYLTLTHYKMHCRLSPVLF